MAISGEKNSEKSLYFWFKMATFSAQNRLRDCKMTHDFLNKWHTGYTLYLLNINVLQARNT